MIWFAIALGVWLIVEISSFLFVPRDFTGNDGCADDRVW